MLLLHIDAEFKWAEGGPSRRATLARLRYWRRGLVVRELEGSGLNMAEIRRPGDPRSLRRAIRPESFLDRVHGPPRGKTPSRLLFDACWWS